MLVFVLSETDVPLAKHVSTRSDNWIGRCTHADLATECR